jgi:SAM-dependent methyltransferase
MNSLNDSGSIFKYHRDMINQYGYKHSKALGWLDNDSQLTRFKVLAQIADLNNCSVLDAGCGYGDLSAYLYSIYPNMNYCGIEQIPELLEEAERRYGGKPETRFLCGNFLTGKLPVVDYVLACGSLNYCSDDPDFIFNAINKLYQSCKLALGFNLLSHIAKNGFITAYNPQSILTYCRTLSSNVQFLDDYDTNDYTILVYHDA